MDVKVEIPLPSAFVGVSKDEPLCWGTSWTLCHGRAEAEQVSNVSSTSPSSQATFLEVLPNPLSPLGLSWLSQPETRCRWPLLFLLRCACGWEKSDLMELLLRKAVNMIFSLMFTQLESWWRFRRHFPRCWGCVMCSVTVAPAQRGPSSCSKRCQRGRQVPNPHPPSMSLPTSLSLSQICLV